MPVPTPRILPGRLHKENKGCIDWGSQNLIAYGCHSYVVIVDPSSMSTVQTLDEHILSVCLVKWPHESIRQDSSQYVLKIASGDVAGNIIVWNVHEGSVISTMTDKPLIDMKWHPEDTTLLAALHAPNSLCLWSVTSGSRIWKKDVSDHSVSTFIFDPFDYSLVTVASAQGFIYSIQDFKTVSAPTQVDFKYKINSRATSKQTVAGKQPANIDFVQMSFSPHSRNVVYIMLSRELLIFDTTTNQSLGSIVLERSRASFSQMCLYKESPDVLFCLHEDGAITAWIRKRDATASHNYEMVSLGDLAYLNKKSKKKATPVVGISKAPFSDHSIVAVCADGSVCTWNYISSRLSVTGVLTPLTSTITSICVSPFDDVNPKVAFGTTNGTIVIANFQTRDLEKEFVVGHASQAIHGVKWIGPTRLVCFSCDESQDKPGMYKNTLCWIDIQSGKTREFRRITAPEPTFIRGIRVSPLRQYLILLLKDRPFELWELRSFSLTRTFKQFAVTALEWAIRDAPPPSPSTNHTPFTSTSSQSSFTSSLSLNIPSFSSLASTFSSLASDKDKDRQSPVPQTHPSVTQSTPPTPFPALSDDDLDLHPTSTPPAMLSSHIESENESEKEKELIDTFNNSGNDDTTPSSIPTTSPPTPLHSRNINTSFNNVYFNVDEIDNRNVSQPHTMPEMFVFTSSDGMVRFFSVDGSNITPNEIQVDLGPGVVSSLAWKNDLLVSGDTAGTIHCWHLDKRKLQTYATHKGLIKRIRFSPAPYSTYVIVLFAGGDFGIWDLQHGIRLSISSYLFQREVKATEVDWLTEAAPIITTTDGCVRVLDKSLSISNSRLATTTLGLMPDSLGYMFMPLSTPHLLNDTVALHLKALLSHQSANSSYSFDKDNSDISTSLLSLIDSSFLSNLRQLSVAERCLAVARYFGDCQEIDFWILAINFIEKYAQQVSAISRSVSPATTVAVTPKKSAAFFSINPKYPESPMSPIMSPVASPRPRRNTPITQVTPLTQQSSSSSLQLQQDDFNTSSLSSIPRRGEEDDENSLAFSQDITPDSSLSETQTQQLPLYFDLLLPGETVKELETERANVHSSKPAQDGNLAKTLVEKNIFVGRSEKSVSILLDTNTESPDFVANSLKACVIAATIGPDSLAKTVKVVATSMIASNKIDEGVQLLCLIGKGLDACRYLQSYDRWHDAALVAKTYLNETECSIIMRKWAQFLISSNQKVKAIHILLSLGEFQKVLQVLRDIRKPDTAALFSLACIEKKLLCVDPLPPSDSESTSTSTSTSVDDIEKDKDSKEKDAQQSIRSSSELLNSSIGVVDPSNTSAPLLQLLENIYHEYATMLQQVGCTAGALNYLAKSGRVSARKSKDMTI